MAECNLRENKNENEKRLCLESGLRKNSLFWFWILPFPLHRLLSASHSQVELTHTVHNLGTAKVAALMWSPRFEFFSVWESVELWWYLSVQQWLDNNRRSHPTHQSQHMQVSWQQNSTRLIGKHGQDKVREAEWEETEEFRHNAVERCVDVIGQVSVTYRHWFPGWKSFCAMTSYLQGVGQPIPRAGHGCQDTGGCCPNIWPQRQRVGSLQANDSDTWRMKTRAL